MKVGIQFAFKNSLIISLGVLAEQEVKLVDVSVQVVGFELRLFDGDRRLLGALVVSEVLLQQTLQLLLRLVPLLLQFIDVQAQVCIDLFLLLLSLD